MLEARYPKKIIMCEKIENKENLLKKQRLQIDLNELNIAVFHKGGYVILDYGRELRGGVRLFVSSSDGSKIRVRFGESVAECCSELGVGEVYAGNTDDNSISELAKRQNATNDHAMRDFYISLPSWSSSPIGDTGFRFVRLDFDGEYVIKSIVAESVILKRRAKYIYHGEREIERIFNAAKRTVDLCVSSGYVWDGIKRDRLVWVGDMAPEVLALTTLYGRCREIEDSLELACEHTPLPRYMDNITTYSLWWIIILKDYLDRTGAVDLIEKQLDYLEALTELFLSGVDENGEMSYPSYFVNWPLAGQMEEREGFRAIAIAAMRAAEYILLRFGRNAEHARSARERFEKKRICATTRVVAALKHYATGTLSKSEREILMSEGSGGMSTFMAYYILHAMAAYDREKAIAVMKEYFGGMLALGSTTFWEEFDIEWAKMGRIDRLPKKGELCAHGNTGDHCYVGFRMSLCHGWAAGVIAFIKEWEE